MLQILLEGGGGGMVFGGVVKAEMGFNVIVSSFNFFFF